MPDQKPDPADIAADRVQDLGRELLKADLPADIVAAAFLQGARAAIVETFGTAVWTLTLQHMLQTEVMLDRPAGNT
jgi:hypothetical protein